MDKSLEDISSRLVKKKFRHEIHRFPSGAVMIDIWKDELLYVIQIYNNTIGLSLITPDNPGFDTVPDTSYDDWEKFNKDFEAIFR